MRENTDHKKLRIWTLFTQCPFLAAFVNKSKSRIQCLWNSSRLTKKQTSSPKPQKNSTARNNFKGLNPL